MRILIVEDEPPIAEDIERTVRALLGRRVEAVTVCWTLEKAVRRLEGEGIDLCLLDLNLSGKSGFALLRQAVARPFPTIVISAHTEQALRAFEYGVLDFVPKPFTRERLKKALDRCFDRRRPDPGSEARVLAARRGRDNLLVPTIEVLFFKAARCLVEAHLEDGRLILLDKPLDQLEKILPPRFLRVHRSFLVDRDRIASYAHGGGGRYRLRLKS